MKILIYYDGYIPVFNSSGPELIVEALMKGLKKKNFKVVLCSYGKTNNIDHLNLNDVNVLNLAKEFDIVHFNSFPKFIPKFNYIYTHYSMSSYLNPRLLNTVFINYTQARLYASKNFIDIGLNFENYHANIEAENYYVYLYDGVYKNCNYAINIARSANEHILVLGTKVWYNNYEKLSYIDYIDDEQKLEILSKAKAIINLNTNILDLPITCIQALAYGTPIILFKNLILEEKYKKGLVFCENIKDFIKAMSLVQNINRIEIASYFKNIFSYTIMVEKYINLYTLVIKNGVL